MSSPIKRSSISMDLHSLGKDWAVPSDGLCAVFDREIFKSPNDIDRSYELVKLRNGLTALLVSDPTTDKAAASLSIGVGHLSDPDDLPGLAHFCEHMLFLGTERFPQEDAYKTYLSQNAGSSNASTSMDETNYYFDVHPSGLAGALERHSQFFTAPLFLPSCTEREVKAVDSEFRRNLQLDSRRLFQLGKATSSRQDGNVYWKFGTGSIETLWHEPVARGEDVRQRLLDWYAANYSANRMALCVISNQPLDELRAMVQANYADIPNLELPILSYPPAPLGEAELNQVVFYRTIKDTPQMRIVWPFEDQQPQWQTKPGRLLGHFIGHEGKGSILSALKKRGWATSLSSGSGGGAAGFSFFTVDISLTPTGLESWSSVLKLVQDYIEVLARDGPLKAAFDETHKLGEISWRFKEKNQPGSLARNMSSQLHMPYPPDKLLVAPWFPTEFDEASLKRHIDALRRPCRVLLGSKKPLDSSHWDQTEKHYGTEYSIQPLKSGKIDGTAELKMPDRNIFVPSHLGLVSDVRAKEPARRPLLIRQTSLSRLFFKKDDTWLVPRAAANFHLRSALADASPTDAMKTQLVTALLEEVLTEETYPAALAGLHYSVGSSNEGVQVFVSGYSEKLGNLLVLVVERLRNLDFSDDLFKLVSDRLKRAYANAKLSNPSTLADNRLRHAVSETHWTWDERLDALEHITAEAVKSHVAPLLSSLNIVGLVHGNVLKEDAINLLKGVEEALRAQPADPARNDYHRALVVPPRRNYVFRTDVPSDENVNSAASVYYSIGPSLDDELNCRLDLFAQIARVPVFSTLRTKEQLGYIVSSGAFETGHHAGFRVIVQSEKTAEFLEERIEEFWRSYATTLRDMSQEEFDQQKQALINKRLEKPKNLNQEGSRYYIAIEDGTFDFFWRDRHIRVIQTLMKDDMARFFDRYISPASKDRAKLSILMRSQRYQLAQLEPLRTALSDAGVPADKVEELLSSKPTLSRLRAFVEEMRLTSTHVSQAIDTLQVLPALPEGVTEVESLDELRKTFERGPPVVPIDDFTSDLSAHL